MALFASGGKLLTAGAGKLASSSGCCCKPEEDPERIVKCCFNGVCAEITAAECAFLGGQSVSDCASCVPPTAPRTNSTNCRTCCDSVNVAELDALFSMYVSDPLCVGIFGQGCNATRSYGRLGESLVAQAQITLRREFSGSCRWTFSSCVPLGQYGNITRLQVAVSFGLRRLDGQSIIQNGCGNALNPACECVFSLGDCLVQIQTCGFSDNANPESCTAPARGGSCQQTIGGGGVGYQATMPGICRGSASASRQDLVSWQSFGGCWSTISALLVTGSPKRRDVGFQECGLISASPTGETTHTIKTRAVITIL